MQLDWLTLNFQGTITSNPHFRYEKDDIPNPYFNSITNIYVGNRLFCIACSFPKSTIIDPALIQIKFANEYLYREDFKYAYDLFKSVNSITFKSFSRIDICYDFHRFANNLRPQQFIKNFLDKKYLKYGKTKFSLQGNNYKGIVYDYLRLGSKSSDIHCYLYNKTKELREVKPKPHIVSSWAAAGLDSRQEVWRLEFCIRLNTIEFINESTGNVYTLQELDIFKPAIIKEMYSALLFDYFKFYHNEGKARKERNKELILFKNLHTPYKIYYSPKQNDTIKSDKILLNKLLNIYDILRNVPFSDSEEYAILAKKYAIRQNMTEHYTKKLNLIVPNNARK